MFNIGVLLAALGITLLEMSEASAVGITLYGDSGRKAAYTSVALGAFIVLAITAGVGDFISIFPIFYVRLASATLLLYFGIRLIRSARRSFRFQRLGAKGKKHDEGEVRGLFATGFSVGAVEAFEAAIVLVGLFPEGYYSTLTGLIAGVAIVMAAAYILKSQVRKVKQAIMKVVVSALLLSFATFWYIEAFQPINDVFLAPMFVVYAVIVYAVGSHNISVDSEVHAETDQ